MKSIKFWFVLLLVSSVNLAACSAKKPETATTATTTTITSNSHEKGIQVDKKILNVVITFPASLMEMSGEDSTLDVLTDEMKENGIKEVVKNQDGSVTYTMTKSAHKELLADLRNDLEASIAQLAQSDETPSIKDVTYNKGLTKFQVVVNREAFENNFDAFSILGLSFYSLFYQAFEGVNSTNLKTTIDYVDIDTDEVFDTVVFPDAWENFKEG